MQIDSNSKLWEIVRDPATPRWALALVVASLDPVDVLNTLEVLSAAYREHLGEPITDLDPLRPDYH